MNTKDNSDNRNYKHFEPLNKPLSDDQIRTIQPLVAEIKKNYQKVAKDLEEIMKILRERNTQ